MNTTLLILMILCLLLAGFFLKAEHEQKYVLAVILKGLASLMFVIMGYLAYTRVNNIFNKIFYYGLIFGSVSAQSCVYTSPDNAPLLLLRSDYSCK